MLNNNLTTSTNNQQIKFTCSFKSSNRSTKSQAPDGDGCTRRVTSQFRYVRLRCSYVHLRTALPYMQLPCMHRTCSYMHVTLLQPTQCNYAYMHAVHNLYVYMRRNACNTPIWHAYTYIHRRACTPCVCMYICSMLFPVNAHERTP
jgi:hypothetical protein